MVRHEIVDVCQPIDIVIEERKALERRGFVLVDQHGGGDLGSGLVYADYKNATEEERKEIMRRHENHKARCALIASAMAQIFSA